MLTYTHVVKNSIAGMIALCALLGFAGMVHAAYPIEKIPGGEQVFGDFVVGPTKTDVTIKPGQSREVELTVTNRMGSRRVFNLEIEDAKGSDDPNQAVVLLGDDRGPYSLKDYIRFPESSFELAQGERARIMVTISIPANAQPGGLYGSVLVTTDSLPSDDAEAIKAGTKAGSVIVSRIGALFFVTVPGDVKKAGFLEKFTTAPEGKTFFNQGPVKFQVLFRNNGTIHLNPSATISIKNMLGEEVGSIVAEPWYSFPQSVRMRELTWNRDYLFGRYTAELSLNRGYDNLVDTAQVTFYVIPWQLVAGAFAGLMLIFLFLRFVIRKFEIKRR